MAWNVEGSYIETCSCETLCPCIFTSKPTQGYCTGLICWHIEKGDDDGVDLSGLNVALAVHSPGRMADGGWKVRVYVDAKANEQQNAAIMRIWGGQAGGHLGALAPLIGEILGVEQAPIQFDRKDKGYTVKVGSKIDAEVHPIEGADGGPVLTHNVPFPVGPGFPVTAAKSHHFNLTDGEWAWKLSERNSFLSQFKYQA